MQRRSGSKDANLHQRNLQNEEASLTAAEPQPGVYVPVGPDAGRVLRQLCAQHPHVLRSRPAHRLRRQVKVNNDRLRLHTGPG